MVLRKTLISAALLILAFTVIRYGWQWRIVDTGAYSWNRAEAARLSRFAEAQYDYGNKAWIENRPVLSGQYFRNAVAADPLHVDAWLKLAESDIGSGKTGHAEQVAGFVDRLTGPVAEWKWKLILLEQQLGMTDAFLRNLNFVVPLPAFGNDALQLIDLHCGADTAKTMELLDPDNLAHYLQWLMKWHRTADSLEVWASLCGRGAVEDRLRQRFVNYLAWQKEIRIAAAIWQEHTGAAGITNPGFERPITDNAFDWRPTSGDHWGIRRTGLEASAGGFSLETDFSGKENVDFYHLRQIVPVEPGKSYTLSCSWRSRNITTDQRPYLEICAYDKPGIVARSDMIPAFTDWRRETVAFTAPEDAHAVVLRLRRNKSHRFDCRIDGRLWLDDFSLRETETE